MNLRDVQTALLSLGFDPGPVDGKPGRKTMAALEAFQRSRWLLVDGMVGPNTIAALQAAVAERAEPRTVSSASLLTPAIIRAVAPKARQDIVDELVSGFDRFSAAGVVTPLRMAHFLSESATETDGLTKLEESLNYSVEGLLKTFTRSRISSAQCQALGRKQGRAAQQEQIANIIYGGDFGRKSLGNTQPGDGWRYRGSGLLQTTGRANTRRAGFEDIPDVLRQPGGALAAALTFWTDNNLNALADAGPVAPVRKRINGGTNGLAEAVAYFAKARKALRI